MRDGQTSNRWYRFWRELWDRLLFLSQTPVIVTATSYTASGRSTVFVDDDTAGGAVAVTLPPAAQARGGFWVIKTGSTGAVTIAPSGDDSIEAAVTPVPLAAKYNAVYLAPDGVSSWWVLASK